MIDSCSLEASAGAVGSAVAKLRSKATSERRRKAIGAERYRDGCRDAQPILRGLPYARIRPDEKGPAT